MSDLSLSPEEVLRRYAKQLDARREIDPSARPWYDIFGDALMWPDERVPDAPMELIGPVRRLYYHRMGLILGEDWGQGEFWQLARELFPNWVGLHPSRSNPSDELARIYHAYASNLKRELEEMDKLCDEEEN